MDGKASCDVLFFVGKIFTDFHESWMTMRRIWLILRLTTYLPYIRARSAEQFPSSHNRTATIAVTKQLRFSTLPIMNSFTILIAVLCLLCCSNAAPVKQRLIASSFPSRDTIKPRDEKTVPHVSTSSFKTKTKVAPGRLAAILTRAQNWAHFNCTRKSGNICCAQPLASMQSACCVAVCKKKQCNC